MKYFTTILITFALIVSLVGLIGCMDKMKKGDKMPSHPTSTEPMM